MLWIQLERAVFDHRKTLRLSVRLGVRATHLVGHLGQLWTWALRSAPSGDLGELEAEVIARAADWTGDLLDVADAERFVAELLAVGFLDRLDGGGLRLHGWRERHELWADRRERESRAAEDAEAERKRRDRERAASYRARQREATAVDGGRHVTAPDGVTQTAVTVPDGRHGRLRDGQAGDGDGERDGDSSVTMGVTLPVTPSHVTNVARPDRTGPEITGPEITGPDVAGVAPPAPRKRGVRAERSGDGGGYFGRAGAVMVTGQWLRWAGPDDRPPWEEWVRSHGRDDLVNRPPPDGLIASVSEALERQRGQVNGQGPGVNGHTGRLESEGHG